MAIITMVAESLVTSLDDVQLSARTKHEVNAFDVPVPFSPPLEFATIPDEERIVEAVYQLLGK